MSSAVTTQVTDLQNYVNGAWRRATATEYLTSPSRNRGTPRAQHRSRLSLTWTLPSNRCRCFPAWRRTPPGERVQYLFS